MVGDVYLYTAVQNLFVRKRGQLPCSTYDTFILVEHTIHLLKNYLPTAALLNVKCLRKI